MNDTVVYENTQALYNCGALLLTKVSKDFTRDSYTTPVYRLERYAFPDPVGKKAFYSVIKPVLYRGNDAVKKK